VSSTTPTVAGRFVRFVFVAALAGAFVNLGAVAVTPSESRAIVRHDGAQLGELLAGEQDFVAERYELFGRLREFAGARIQVPEGLLDDYVLQYLSQLEPERVERRRRIPERILDDIEGFTRADGFSETTIGSGDVRRFVVATMDEAPDTLAVYVSRRSGTILVVDGMLAGEQGLP
jgi:hypothetical protein